MDKMTGFVIVCINLIMLFFQLIILAFIFSFAFIGMGVLIIFKKQFALNR